MAELTIAGIIFGGVTALMNAASAYGQYRANHPRRNRIETGEVSDYTSVHHGYSMLSRDCQRPVPQYQHLISRAPDRSSSSASGSGIWSQQQLAQRSASGRQLYHNASSVRRSRDGFGGTVLLSEEQKATDTYTDDHYGLNTGILLRRGSSRREMDRRTKTEAETHWKSFHSSTYVGGDDDDARSAVAVVDWTKSQITMFVERNNTYYLQYKVKSCDDVAGFAEKYRQNEVFSGIVEGGQLKHCNDELKIVEDDRGCRFRSSNCWTELGISSDGAALEVAGDPMFVEMVRGAVFGLICCVHKDPSLMNVDMNYGNGVDFVHVDTREDVEPGPDCMFSVFSFCKDGWAEDKVLVG